MTPSTMTSPHVSAKQIETYRRDGFVKIEQIISPEEVSEYYRICLDISDNTPSRKERSVFDQHVNVWRDFPSIKPLTLHPNIALAAQTLAGMPMRLWHDHILIKRPHNNVATEFHQDQPYWSHTNSFEPISCWLALCDVPVEKGCMTFLPGSHRHTGLAAQNLLDDEDLFGKCEELRWSQRVTVPLKAGDCTFHHGRCAHMATANFTDDPRVAHVIIFMDAATKYHGKPHCVTDPLDLEPGATLDGELFPSVDDIIAQKV